MTAADDAVSFIKREPLGSVEVDASRVPPALPTHAPVVATNGAAQAAKRDHLRALLDRARAKTTQARSDVDAHVQIKSEPNGGDASVASTVACTEPRGQGGLLPTPRLPMAAHAPERVRAMAIAQSVIPTYPTSRYEITPRASMVHPPIAYHQEPSQHNHHAHPHTTKEHQLYSLPPTQAPASAHAPTCPCSLAFSVGSTHHHTDSAHHGHYQAHPPPALTMQSRAPYPTDDHATIGHALSVHTTTISPSMSATTSSSSSSNTKRKARPAPSRRDHVLKLSPSTFSSLEEYEDNELHSDFVHAVHLLIPDGSFGCLVGHRGEFMKELNAVSECTLSVRDGSSFPMFDSDRVLRIYGKPKGICLAQQIVIERIRNYRAHKSDSSYVDLGEELLTPMDKTSVTRAMSEAMKTDIPEDDADSAAEHGELRWLIPKESVGKIMGQAGHIQKAIARDTNTVIHIVPTCNMAPGSTERTVIITGQPNDIKRALTVIENKAGGRLQTRGVHSGRSGEYYVFPQHVAGFLIGPSGARIRQVRDDTGARIQIAAQHDLPLGYVNRMLHIQGKPEQMEKARAALVRRLQSYMQSPESTSAAIEDEIALQLVLPVRICSFLLDQRGRLIREISEKAGAHARFLPPLDEDNRVCVLYGDMAKVFRAERLVLQFIAGDAIANKWATAGGAPPRKRKRTRNNIDEDGGTNRNENFDEVEFDDDAIAQEPRGRGRKRQQIENSGRIVVHYSEPSKKTSSQVANRRSSNGRNSSHGRSSGRGKRRR